MEKGKDAVVKEPVAGPQLRVFKLKQFYEYADLFQGVSMMPPIEDFKPEYCWVSPSWLAENNFVLYDIKDNILTYTQSIN